MTYDGAAVQLETITDYEGSIDYGIRTPSQVEALDEAMELAIKCLKESAKMQQAKEKIIEEVKQMTLFRHANMGKTEQIDIIHPQDMVEVIPVGTVMIIINKYI